MDNSQLLKDEKKTKIFASYYDKFNIIIMGETGVGKTELLKNLSSNKSNKFKIINQDNDYNQNSNFNTNDIIERISLEFHSEEKEFLIKIWNYCYISDPRLINDFMRKADAFMIVYSILDKNSFNNVEKWINEAKNKTSSKKIKFFIIGNKNDKINERQVGVDEIKQFSEKDNYKFFEISSFNKKDLENSFCEIFLDVINTTYSDSEYSQLSCVEDNKNKKCCDCCKKYCNIF